MTERKRANIYLEADIYDKAREKAKKMGLSFSAFVNLCVYEFLKQDSVVALADVYSKLLKSNVEELKEVGK